jgi:signal transduction histidine kinase
MINAHNGRVWAEQRDNGGTRFVVELPLVYPNSLQEGFSEEEQ